MKLQGIYGEKRKENDSDKWTERNNELNFQMAANH
jgi:hypothetical protein